MVMREIAGNALTHVLDVKAGEHLLIVTDEHRIEIGNAFYEAGDEIGMEGRLFVLEDGERPLTELPHDLKRALDGANVMISVFVGYPEETPFRVDLLRTAKAADVRTGHGPGISDDMMIEGAMRVDFRKLADIGDLMEELLEGAVRAHLTSPEGADIWFTVRGRRFESDVRIGPATFGNLPNGEVRVAPLEAEAQGTLVCDSSIGDLGKVPSPVTIEVVAGRITSIRGDDQALVERLEELTSIDDEASVIGELAFGINPLARVTGNMLEDEKALGTVHVAFGNNIEMGGKNGSRTHRDFHLKRPTLTVEFEDGHTRDIIRDGCLLD
ncbi:MAG: aminopeptidase [Thermoplasmata archaeon]|nr:MAG: aminopeptidase [Thermoplasmata archaeon]